MANNGAEISSHIKEILEDIFNTKINDGEITLLGQSEKDEGYIGDVFFVKIDGSINKNLVLKCGKTSKELRRTIPVKSTYENEIYLYDVVMDHFKAFQMQKGVSHFSNVPKYYGHFNVGEFEMIVLENLKSNGYEMHDKRETMDLSHIKIVLEAYAKWHAISIALNDQNPEYFDELTDKIINIWKEFKEKTDMPRMFETNVKMGLNWMKDKLTPENYEKVSKFANEARSIMGSFCEDVSPKPYFVISHGDSWNNNFMFKYENEVPVDVRILDWQCCRRICPTYDLIYFLFTCISKDDLSKLDDILRFYYDILNNEVQMLGSNLKDILSYKTLIDEFRKTSEFGLTFAFTAAKICTLEKDQAFDITEAIEKGEDAFSGFLNEPNDTRPFVERTLPIVQYFLEENLL